jgi:hypothetical protein
MAQTPRLSNEVLKTALESDVLRFARSLDNSGAKLYTSNEYPEVFVIPGDEQPHNIPLSQQLTVNFVVNDANEALKRLKEMFDQGDYDG